jgi:hypothetical protein
MRIVAAILLLASAWNAEAAVQRWWFDDRRYYEPLIAGVREPHLSALAFGHGTKMSFQVSDADPRSIWDIDVGGELPIAGLEWGETKNGRVEGGGFGIGLWIPIDFHMISDHDDRSGPIVNNDYRFGGMVKAQYGLTAMRAVATRLHVGHESTHLGDEFSIVGQRSFRDSFERINVSWEYADLGALYEDIGAKFPFSVRAGATYNLRGSYYEVGPDSITESRVGPVVPSHNRCDPYAGIDVKKEEAIGRWDVYASAEMRWRTVYDYHRASRDIGEERQMSWNLILGTKLNGTNKASPFVRLYRGVNPHGQFRNQKDYSELGIGIRLVR